MSNWHIYYSVPAAYLCALVDRTRILSHAALFIVALLYGGNYLIAKNVMTGEYIRPLGFVLLRVVTATSLFWLVSAIGKPERISRSDLIMFILCGLTGVAANQSLFFSGLKLTTPIHASLIMTTSPMVVLIFSFLIIGEAITPKKILGIVIGCAGAVMLMTAGQQIDTSPDFLTGDLLVFLNASSYALYLVLVKRLTGKYAPLTVVKWVFLFGLLFTAPLGFGQVMEVDWYTFDVSVWLSVVYVLIGVTFLAYLLNLVAMRHVNPSTVSIYIYLQPLCASVLSVVFEAEVMTTIKVVSGLLIFTGVFLVSDFSVSGRRHR